VTLFPTRNSNYLKQNKQLSTEIISFLSFLLHDPRAYEQLKSMFKQDDQGNLRVCFKAPEEFKLKTTKDLQYNYDQQSNECTFVIPSQQFDAILTQNDGIETNCFALKILLHIASHYEYNEQKNEISVDASLVTAPEGFLNEIFATYPFTYLTIFEIHALNTICPELPIYVRLESNNDEYLNNNIVITEISTTQEVVLGKKLADNQPVHYTFSEIKHLNYIARIFPGNQDEKLLINLIERCDPWELENLIKYPEITQMLRLKLEVDDSCSIKALKRILMACESNKIRENWSKANHEQRITFLNFLESGVQTREEIFLQFYLQNLSLFEEERVPIETTIALILQTNEFQKLTGNHEDCFFQSTNITEEALQSIAQKSLQTPADFRDFFSKERTLTPLQQFNNFYRLKQYNPKLALDLAVYSLEHSVEIFNQLPEEIIAELDSVPQFEKWLKSILMMANSNAMEAQRWFDFRSFIMQQETDFQCRDQYDVAIRAEQLIEDIKNLRYKDFPEVTLSELIEKNKVSKVIIREFRQKIAEIEYKARDSILSLTTKELQEFAFNFHECTSKAQLNGLKSKLNHQIYVIVNHPLCAEIGRREMENPSPKLLELYDTLKRTYERLEQEFQEHSKPFKKQITSARQQQFNVARAQLSEELERLNGEEKNTLTAIITALDKLETVVFASEDKPLDQNLTLHALDDILCNREDLGRCNKRTPVIVRQINRAVNLLAAEVNLSDDVPEYSAHASGFTFFSPQQEARNSEVDAFAEDADSIGHHNKNISG